MEHFIAVGGLMIGVVVWFLLQRATGTTETAGRGRCGGCECGGGSCQNDPDKAHGE